MELPLYKDVKTKRGFNYHYYHTKTIDNKPTLVFVHGFPSSSEDWIRQAVFFKAKGYGLVIPDMLGYGGTDIPTDPDNYRIMLLAEDVMSILDYEDIDKVILIAHDWGSAIASRMVTNYPDRIIAVAFLAVGYQPPSPSFDYEETMKLCKTFLGTELLGYWNFLCREDIGELLKEHFDTFFSIGFPHKPEVWRDHLAPPGAYEKAILSDLELPFAPYFTENDKQRYKEILLKGGFQGPACYYKAQVQKLNARDDANVPLDHYTVKVPVFFGAALNDFVCRPEMFKPLLQQFCPNFKLVEFDSDHWIYHTHSDKVNEELLSWIEKL